MSSSSEEFDYDGTPEFVKYFAEPNSHMILIKESENRYCLIPPNQCDWFYTITKKSEDTWNVKGIKEDIYLGADSVDIDYSYVDGSWVSASN